MAGFELQLKERAKGLKVFFKKGVKIVGNSCKKVHVEFLNSKQASLMANNSAEVQSVTPTDLEKVIMQFESTSLKHPPMPASPKLHVVAPSTLNFNSPSNRGHQVKELGYIHLDSFEDNFISKESTRPHEAEKTEFPNFSIETNG
ncbi:hypothetical protein V6N12_043396 [Hibiscus sabdariffa]|uniref:Uncharacterized protein n=1 Tax=Hibiscus sabdariffa TaxID=183260 RepID=A0ABR2DE78_9ROSI